MHTVWATFIPRITPGKRPGLRMLLGAFRGGNPLERIVAVPSLWPRPGGGLQQHGLGGSRPGGLLPSCPSLGLDYRPSIADSAPAIRTFLSRGSREGNR